MSGTWVRQASRAALGSWLNICMMLGGVGSCGSVPGTAPDVKYAEITASARSVERPRRFFRSSLLSTTTTLPLAMDQRGVDSSAGTLSSSGSASVLPRDGSNNSRRCHYAALRSFLKL